MSDQYRKCVGIMLLNNKNEILVGRRIDNPSGFWQMPQGGIDNNENPKEAVWREMMEEIGTNNAVIIKESTKWFSYKIPENILSSLPWGKEYVGQNQKWFVFRFVGKDTEINVNTANPEFSEWKWINHIKIRDNVVPFKKDIYAKILIEFKKIFNKD